MYTLSRVDEFLDAWENTNLYKTNLSLIQSEFERNGRICNDINTLSGPVLDKNNKNFFLAIEAGVVDLIRILIFDYKLITICSCEGHFHLSNQFNISKRFAKILWRNKKEYELLYPVFKKIADETNQGFKNIKIALFDFEDEFPNHEIYHLCFIVFIPFNSNPIVYFNEINSIYHRFIQTLILKKDEIFLS